MSNKPYFCPKLIIYLMTSSLHQVNLPLQFNQVMDLVKQLGAEERQQLLLFLLGREPDSNDMTLTHFASEKVLSKDWLAEMEDQAWRNL